MNMKIGIRAFGHDATLSYIDLKNKKIFAVDTERITRIKHDQISFFPAFNLFFNMYELDTQKINILTFVHSFTSIKKKKFFRNYRQERWELYRKAYGIKYAKDEFKANICQRKIKDNYSFLLYESLNRISKKEIVENYINKYINGKFFKTKKITINHKYYDHHLSHNISSFAFSPFKDSLTCSIDGYGDGYFNKVFLMEKKEKIDYKPVSKSKTKLIYKEFIPFLGYEFEFTNSLGSLYNYFTYKLGYIPNSDEGKVEALSKFGKPIQKLKNLILSSYSVSEKGITTNNENLKKVYGFNLSKFNKEDIAASLQESVEEIVLTYLHILKQKYLFNNLTLAGGLFSNVSLNGKIFNNICENIYVFPAMGDNGSSLGALILELLKEYNFENLDWIENTMPFWGPSYTQEEILTELEKFSEFVDYEIVNNFEEKIAIDLNNYEIVAIFNGNMEYGPRALGNRSILANPKSKKTVDRINNGIKKREKFQPFCPIALWEENYIFEKCYKNIHMTAAFKVKDKYIDLIPAVVHIDKTARVQFVEESTNNTMYKVLKHFKLLSGIGILLNTSFNLHGRTIVMTPKDAIVDFISSDIDKLYFGSIKVFKRF